MNARLWLLLGAVLGGLAVVLGAFGAHRLETTVESWPIPREEQLHLLEVWRTAAQYQMYHALALLAVGLLALRRESRCYQVAGVAFAVGAVIFSFSLYLLVLTHQKWLGAITPIGGVGMIAGWAALAIGVWRMEGGGESPTQNRDAL